MNKPKDIPNGLFQNVATAPLYQACLLPALVKNMTNPATVWIMPHVHCKKMYGIYFSFNYPSQY